MRRASLPVRQLLSQGGSADMTQNSDTVKNTLDILSVFATIGSFLEMLTPIFGLIGAIWTVMRIAEMVAGKPFAEIIRRKKPDASNE
jgi:hypothetical protein